MLKFTKKILGCFQPKEYKIFLGAIIIFLFAAIARTTIAVQENSQWMPVAGGVYREGIIGQPIFINPVISSNQTDQDIAALIYARLNQLMDSFEVQDNGRTYIILLKEKLVWNDDQPVTADDVIFTIQLIQNPETKSPLVQGWQGVIAERISEIKIKFSLPAPYAFFLDHISRLPIIPRHIFSQIPVANLKLSVYNLEPVGNGPYRFDGFSKRKDGFITEYRLTTNESFAGPKPYIENFIFKFYENEDEIFEAFRMRKIDGFGSLKPVITNGVLPKQTIIKQIPMPRYYALFFNPNINPVLKNTGFRQALNEAINKELLIKEVFEGNAGATIVNGPLIKNTQTAAVLTFNPDSAKEKLGKIKIDNLGLTIITPNIDFLRKTAAFIQQSWQAIGISKINIIELNPEEIINDVVKSRNYEILLFGQIPEKTEDLFPFWHSSQRFHPGLNLALYNNAEVDKLTEKIRQELRQEFQSPQLKMAEELIIRDTPAVFLYSLPYTYIHTENLKGFENPIISPSDRFKDVTNWHIISVRLIK